MAFTLKYKSVVKLFVHREGDFKGGEHSKPSVAIAWQTITIRGWSDLQSLSPVSMYRPSLLSITISMLKIRRCWDLIFDMRVPPYIGKTASLYCDAPPPPPPRSPIHFLVRRCLPFETGRERNMSQKCAERHKVYCKPLMISWNRK